MTWFGREQEILWFDAEHEENELLLTVLKLEAGHLPEEGERKKRSDLMRQCWSR
jgi:hypothetical protein